MKLVRKRRKFAKIFGFLISLLLLSVFTAQVPFAADVFNSDKHIKTGLNCDRCHGAAKVAVGAEVGMAKCLSCHGPYEKLAKRTDAMIQNPHANPHYGDLDCNDCHHGHRADENSCDRCHKRSGVSQPVAPAPAEPADTILKCGTCHSGPQYQKYFSPTAHGKLDCASCHKGIKDFNRHMQGKERAETVSCLTCHKEIQKQGLHATVQKISCLQCHTDIHPKEPAGSKIAKAASEAPASASGTAMECSTCHSGPKYQQHFPQTSHGALTCTTCHLAIKDFTKHMQKKEKSNLISCAVCHRNIEKQYEKSYHALEAKISCLQCHTDIHPEKSLPAKKGKAESMQTCLRCHSDENKYLKRGHTAKALAGNAAAAMCSDCHGIHGTPVFAATGRGIADKRIYYTQLCTQCHREGAVAGQSRDFPMAVGTYGETYHGKAMKLGYPDQAAGCADCHSAHNILPAGDSASALNPGQLVKTCGKCHQGFHPRFISYVPHPNPDNPKGFFGLYLTKKFMIALLAAVFGFFWIHILLWWRKAYAEKSCLVKRGLEFRAELPEEEGRQYVKRFSVRDRGMHVVLILSFFGLVVSGFPLKYPDISWAREFLTLFGGVKNAGIIHRASAAVMWLLFLYTGWLSLKFLFPGFRFKGWVGRLFGPDSLFPRIKDFQDCWGMFKWFFNAGERPHFDRWTYWEKFDFMAVFWGMFIIGISGVIMSIPEWSSYVMPGWMINILYLAHSEEAFLAAIFIFTIHFFNNHLVPDKFPLEKNIFTGSYTVEALKRERPLEYERILEENRLEEIKCKGPGAGIQLFAEVFGMASVLLGLALTALIFWAMFMM